MKSGRHARVRIQRYNSLRCAVVVITVAAGWDRTARAVVSTGAEGYANHGAGLRIRDRVNVVILRIRPRDSYVAIPIAVCGVTTPENKVARWRCHPRARK